MLYKYLVRLLHLSFTLSICLSPIGCPAVFIENFFREHLSAKVLSPVGIQEARNFIECLNMCKCNPCAQRSNGKCGHLALFTQDIAVILSVTIVVYLPLQNDVNVSHVISSAKNSATLILMLPTVRDGIGLILYDSTQGICQNNP